jgi:hypothetical protein
MTREARQGVRSPEPIERVPVDRAVVIAVTVIACFVVGCVTVLAALKVDIGGILAVVGIVVVPALAALGVAKIQEQTREIQAVKNNVNGNTSEMLAMIRDQLGENNKRLAHLTQPTQNQTAMMGETKSPTT